MSEEAILKRLNALEEENAELKKRIRVLEGHLNLDEYWYDELKEIGVTPFCDKVQELQRRADCSRTEEQVITLRRELEKKFTLRTKDVMAVFGFSHYEQARRLMKKTAIAYIETIYETDGRKGQRIRLRNMNVNNVRTIQAVNRMCAQN